MEEWESSGSELPSLNRWSEALAEIQARIAPRFGRAEVRERVGRYLVGLFDRVERKNGWQLAEAIGETGPQGVQRLLNTAVWDTEGVRDDLRRYVVDALGDRVSGVLIVDETGLHAPGPALLWSRSAVHWHGRHDQQRAGWRVPGLCIDEGDGVRGSCALSCHAVG